MSRLLDHVCMQGIPLSESFAKAAIAFDNFGKPWPRRLGIIGIGGAREFVDCKT